MPEAVASRGRLRLVAFVARCGCRARLLALVAALLNEASYGRDLLSPLERAEAGVTAGCVFERHAARGREGTPVIAWEFDSAVGVVRIDGRRYTFRVFEEHFPSRADRAERVGDVSRFRLAGSEVHGEVVATAVRVCAVDDESCEATRYTAQLRIRVAGRTVDHSDRGGCGY